MLKDKMVVWVLEYIVGGLLVVILLASPAFRGPVWTDAFIWATQLFVACLGVILISCASSMRQRMLLAKRLDKLAHQVAAISTSSQN